MEPVLDKPPLYIVLRRTLCLSSDGSHGPQYLWQTSWGLERFGYMNFACWWISSSGPWELGVTFEVPVPLFLSWILAYINTMNWTKRGSNISSEYGRPWPEAKMRHFSNSTCYPSIEHATLTALSSSGWRSWGRRANTRLRLPEAALQRVLSTWRLGGRGTPPAPVSQGPVDCPFSWTHPSDKASSSGEEPVRGWRESRFPCQWGNMGIWGWEVQGRRR